MQYVWPIRLLQNQYIFLSGMRGLSLKTGNNSNSLRMLNIPQLLNYVDSKATADNEVINIRKGSSQAPIRKHYIHFNKSNLTHYIWIWKVIIQ